MRTLSITVALIFLCCACSDYAEPGTIEAETKQAVENLQTGLTQPLTEEMPEPHPTVKEYLTTEREAFEELHSPKTLWKTGFYLQPKRPGYRDGPLHGWLDVLRVNGNCRNPAIGNAGIGDGETAFVSLLGTPHFDNRAEAEKDGFSLTGYRFEDCYMILLWAEGIAEEISFVKVLNRADEEANELLNDFNRVKTPEALLAENATPPFFADLDSGFGAQVFYVNGIHIRENSVAVFNNYEGDICFTSPEEIAYEFIDEDSVFFLQRCYYKDRRKQIANAHDASPNGNLSILDALSERPVNGSGFYIHSADGSAPDVLVYTKHEPSGFAWLNDRYLLFNVYLHDARIFDIWTSMDFPLGELIGRPIVEWDAASFSREETCFSAVSSDAKRYTVTYSFGADGELFLFDAVEQTAP